MNSCLAGFVDSGVELSADFVWNFWEWLGTFLTSPLTEGKVVLPSLVGQNGGCGDAVLL